MINPNNIIVPQTTASGAVGTKTLSPEDRAQLKKVDAAKQFESLILTRLMNEMQATIGEWGMEKDSGTQQIQGIFSMHLAQNLADQGGVGLWQQVLASMNDKTTPSTPDTHLDTIL